MKKYILLSIFLVIIDIANSQNIAIKTFAKDDSVCIRWSPTSYGIWIKGNKYGYKIERILLSKGGNVVSGLSNSMLHNGVIKPLPETEWLPILKQDTVYAPVALQALWGKTFELTSTFKTNIMQAYNKIRENESRFGFAMYCADRSLPVAKALGVYWRDRITNRNEKYIYRVYINAPILEAVDTAYVVVDPNIPPDLYIPNKPQGSLMGNSIILNWESLGTDYVGYHVERSYNGRTFKRITKDLVVPFASKGKMVGYYSDSLDGNRERYIYRIIGVTPFTNYGPYSDTVQIRALKTIVSPSNLDVKIMSKGQQVLLTWEYESKTKDLSHFAILRSSSATGEYEVVGLNIQSSERQWVDTKPLGSGYYKVVALSKLGFRGESLEVFAQLTDDTPPLPPVGIEGTVDTLGVVRLKWTPNTEKDLMGYRVFRSNGIDGEYAQLSKSILIKNSYTDTIVLKTLTKNVYYKLAAVDKRYNSSDLSDVCVLKRPDIVPPAPPVITSVSKVKYGVLIQWINSPSNDVVKNLIFKVDGLKTTLIDSVKYSTEYIDTSKTPNKGTIEYYLKSIDSSGNYSNSTTRLAAYNKNDTLKNGNIQLIAHLKYQSKNIFISLKWDCTENKVYLYKREIGNSFFLFKTINRDCTFNDYNVLEGKTYEYFIRSSENKFKSNIIKMGIL